MQSKVVLQIEQRGKDRRADVVMIIAFAVHSHDQVFHGVLDCIFIGMSRQKAGYRIQSKIPIKVGIEFFLAAFGRDPVGAGDDLHLSFLWYWSSHRHF